MEGTKQGLAAVFMTGIVVCGVVCVVSLVKNQPVIASMGGASGFTLAVGVKAVTGGKA